MATTALEKRAVHLTEIPLNQYATLVQMPDLVTFDFHVEGDHHYVVHFLTPDVFGQEFVTIRKGYNLFTKINCGPTDCYLFDDAQLRTILTGVEHPAAERLMSLACTQGVRPSVCTGPIIIPPTR
jgi:hypothetical protein